MNTKIQFPTPTMVIVMRDVKTSGAPMLRSNGKPQNAARASSVVRCIDDGWITLAKGFKGHYKLTANGVAFLQHRTESHPLPWWKGFLTACAGEPSICPYESPHNTETKRRVQDWKDGYKAAPTLEAAPRLAMSTTRASAATTITRRCRSHPGSMTITPYGSATTRPKSDGLKLTPPRKREAPTTSR